MATIKVKRNSNSRGKCKLAFNKAYKAIEYQSKRNGTIYLIGNGRYPTYWFTPVPDQHPKPKPVIKPDPKTGKFVVEKPERDWSLPQAFPEGYVIPKGVKVLKIAKDDEFVKKGSVGTTIETSEAPFIKWENEDYSLCNHKEDWCQVSFLLAPINPEDHPEHPDFGKVKPAANWQKDIPFEFEFIKSKPQPQPFDIREVIAKYIRQHGTQLTAIQLIGHLTIDAKWQSTEK